MIGQTNPTRVGAFRSCQPDFGSHAQHVRREGPDAQGFDSGQPTPIQRGRSTSGRPAGLLNDQGELFHAISVGLMGDKEQPLVNLSALTGHYLAGMSLCKGASSPPLPICSPVTILASRPAGGSAQFFSD